MHITKEMFQEQLTEPMNLQKIHEKSSSHYEFVFQYKQDTMYILLFKSNNEFCIHYRIDEKHSDETIEYSSNICKEIKRILENHPNTRIHIAVSNPITFTDSVIEDEEFYHTCDAPETFDRLYTEFQEIIRTCKKTEATKNDTVYRVDAYGKSGRLFKKLIEKTGIGFFLPIHENGKNAYNGTLLNEVDDESFLREVQERYNFGIHWWGSSMSITSGKTYHFED